MKTKTLLFLFVILAIFTLVVSCNGETPITKFTVTFNPDNGSKSWTVEVEDGATVLEPEEPSKDGHSFEGWYLGEDAFDFAGTKIKSNIVLSAKWYHDVHSFEDDDKCSICGGIKCGDNVAFTYEEETRTLVFSGSGEMKNYIDEKGNFTIQPWSSLLTTAEAVVVENGITTIGNGAFAILVDEGFNFTSINSVSLPDTLNTIGNYAFSFSGITEIVIPDGTTTIGYFAFGGCEKLESITIPASIKSLGEQLFKGLSMGEMTIIFLGTEEEWEKVNNDDTYIYDIFFPNEGKYGIFCITPSVNHLLCLTSHGRTLETLVVPDKVIHISKNAFKDSEASNVYIPTTVTSIENRDDGTSPFNNLKAGCTVHLAAANDVTVRIGNSNTATWEDIAQKTTGIHFEYNVNY